MIYTLDTIKKTIKINGNFTKVELDELFKSLNIEDIDTYIIGTTTSDFWFQTNTYNPDIQLYSTDNTIDNNLKVVYKNIVDSL